MTAPANHINTVGQRCSIWKVQIPARPGVYDIPDLPKQANLLNVGQQQGVLTLWFEVKPGAPTEPRRYIVRFTGESWDYCVHEYHVGTVIMPGNGLVMHVYEYDLDETFSEDDPDEATNAD
jgi:hypothetical protein